MISAVIDAENCSDALSLVALKNRKYFNSVNIGGCISYAIISRVNNLKRVTRKCQTPQI